MKANFSQELKKESEKILDQFSEEIKTLRTQRPHPGLVENILVDYYGQKTKLKNLATLSVKPPNQIIINCWDKNAVDFIKTALKFSPLNFSPQVEGNIIYLNLPPLTEERKNELVKFLSQKKENFRIKFRQKRDEVLKKIKEEKEKNLLSEDEFFKLKEKIQEITEEFNKEIEKIFETKKNEIYS